jgi:hypothetical protein
MDGAVNTFHDERENPANEHQIQPSQDRQRTKVDRNLEETSDFEDQERGEVPERALEQLFKGIYRPGGVVILSSHCM